MKQGFSFSRILLGDVFFPCQEGFFFDDFHVIKVGKEAQQHSWKQRARLSISDYVCVCVSVPMVTFGEVFSVTVDLQRVEGADLQVNVVVQELLHDGLEREQQLLLLIQLLFARRCQLLFVIIWVDLIGNVLQETSREKKDIESKQEEIRVDV